MPLTLSHPAAVLLLRRLGLPMSALAIGSMVPDLPLFAAWTRGYDFTHSLTGMITADLALTVVALAGWTFWMRDALVDLAPDPVRHRLAPRARLPRRAWLLTPVAAVIGSATHIGWDAFTHPGRWGTAHVRWLREEHAGLDGWSWAQYASGVIGLAIVVAAVVAHLATQPVEARRPPRRLPAATLAGVVAVGVLTAALSAALRIPAGLESMAFHAVIESLVVLGAGLVVVTAAWHVAARNAP